MRTISVEERRRLLVRRHHLAGDADGPESVVRALVALHATDPASVYLSVLARSAATSIDGISAAMYDRRRLVRWMAMRRTLFVVDRDDVPMIQAAVSTPLAAALRRRLLSRLERAGTEPPIDGDLDAWLADVEDAVERAIDRRGTATGAELARDVPALATVIAAHAPSEQPTRATTALLTVMSTAGRLVRGTPTGAWTSRQHRWQPTSAWWPDGLPALDEAAAQQALARRWLARFGPATVEDLEWWTGWNKTVTRRAVAALPTEDVELHGRAGIALADDPGTDSAADDAGAPVATLLPALDPTPMGWKNRDWFLGIDAAAIYDTAGNIGPTLWWNGEIIGSWAVTDSGEVRTVIGADRGRAARTAVGRAAAQLQDRLGGTVVRPVFRTALERSLTG